MAERLNRLPLWADITVAVLMATFATVLGLVIGGGDWTLECFLIRFGILFAGLLVIRVFARRSRS